MGHIDKRPERPSPYRVRYQGADRKEHSKSFGKLDEARRFLREQDALLHRAEWVNPKEATRRLDEYVKHWERTRLHLRPTTRARDEVYLRAYILPTFGDRTLGSVAPIEIQEWVSALSARGLAPATVWKAYQILGNIFRSAVDSELLVKSPVRGVKFPDAKREEQRFLTPREQTELLDVIDERYRVLVLTALHTGMRLGEILGLQVGDLNALKGTLTVNRTVGDVNGKRYVGPPKTDASRRAIAIPRFLVDELAVHLATRATQLKPESFVFEAPRGGPIRPHNFRGRIWKPAVEASVGDPCSFHCLRHTHVAVLVEQRAHAKTIQARLGHSSIRVTLDEYGHLFEGLDQDVADKLDAGWRKMHA